MSIRGVRFPAINDRQTSRQEDVVASQAQPGPMTRLTAAGLAGRTSAVPSRRVRVHRPLRPFPGEGHQPIGARTSPRTWRANGPRVLIRVTNSCPPARHSSRMSIAPWREFLISLAGQTTGGETDVGLRTCSAVDHRASGVAAVLFGVLASQPARLSLRSCSRFSLGLADGILALLATTARPRQAPGGLARMRWCALESD
jgi:hypothetical protein